MTEYKMSKNLLKPAINALDKMKKDGLERKRNILHLILNYLIENNLRIAADALLTDAQLSNTYTICENIDLDIIFQEYQSFYYTKFQKYPKITRKISDLEARSTPIVSSKSSSAKIAPKTADKKDELLQFEVISLSATEEEDYNREQIVEEFKNQPADWQEIAHQIQHEIVPNTTNYQWNDCIGLKEPIESLKEATIYPDLYPEFFPNHLHWNGILLYGPPGTGKTLMAKTLACESKHTFFNLSSSTFVNKYRGESEKMLKVLFELAKMYAPSIIFIDELDALTSSNSDYNHEASRRFKSELLGQIDGISDHNIQKKIFILATTNTPWNIDKAMLRRFDKRIYVALPDIKEKMELFKYYFDKFKLETSENEQVYFQKDVFNTLTLNFSGCDVKVACKEISMTLVREKLQQIKQKKTRFQQLRKISMNDIKLAISKIRPCVTSTDCNKYTEWTCKFGTMQ